MPLRLSICLKDSLHLPKKIIILISLCLCLCCVVVVWRVCMSLCLSSGTCMRQQERGGQQTPQVLPRLPCLCLPSFCGGTGWQTRELPHLSCYCVGHKASEASASCTKSSSPSIILSFELCLDVISKPQSRRNTFPRGVLCSLPTPAHIYVSFFLSLRKVRCPMPYPCTPEYHNDTTVPKSKGIIHNRGEIAHAVELIMEMLSGP